MHFIFFIFFFISTSIAAQTTELEWMAASKTSFDSVFVYIKAHDTLPESTSNYLKEILQKNSQSKTVKNTYYINGIKLLYARAIFKTDIKECLKILDEVDVFLKKNPQFLHFRLVYNMILGRIQLEIYGHCEESLQLYRAKYKELASYEQIDNQWTIVSETKKGIINSLLCLERAQEALELLKNFEKEIKGRPAQNDLVYLWGITGSIHLKLQNYSEAEKYYLKIIALLENTTQNLKPYFIAASGLASMYIGQKNNQAAIPVLEKALAKAKKTSLKNELLLLSNNLGIAYLNVDNYKKAIELGTYVLKNSDNEGYVFHTINAKRLLASVYYNSGEGEKSVAYADEVIDFYRTFKDTKMLRQVLELKNKLFLTMGKFEEAAYVNAEIISLLDSTSLSDNMQNLQRTLIEYETEKKDNEIVILKQKDEINHFRISRQKQFIAALLAGGFLFLLFAAVVFFYQRKITNFEQLLLRSKLVRAQFNPHYINNTFASLQAQLVEKDFDEDLINYTSSIARFSRLLLESTYKDEWTLYEEKQLMENYLKTQQYRLKNSFEFYIDNQIPSEDLQHLNIPSVLTQTVLENALEHGGYNALAALNIDGQNKGKIDISISKTADKIVLSIKNNILQNTAKETVEKRTKEEPARGMEIIQQRIALHQKIHKKPAQFSISMQPSETLVIFELPLIFV